VGALLSSYRSPLQVDEFDTVSPSIPESFRNSNGSRDQSRKVRPVQCVNEAAVRRQRAINKQFVSATQLTPERYFTIAAAAVIILE
jgi:hypothetical protein